MSGQVQTAGNRLDPSGQQKRVGRKILTEYQRQANHPKRVRLKHRGMRGEARRTDSNHERRNSRNENGNPRIRKRERSTTTAPKEMGSNKQRKKNTG